MRLRNPVLASDVALRALCGAVEDRGDHLVVRTPDNPGYFEGNLLVLAEAPDQQSLPRWIDAARSAFADEPRVRHATLQWDGGPLPEAVASDARASGGVASVGLDMRLLHVRPHETTATIRVLSARELDAIEELNRVSDANESAESPDYVAFKQAIRAEWRNWLTHGHARWFGAFRGETLVGQCGLVRQGPVARFQAVETHPARQRTGVATSLIGSVAATALSEGANAVYLVADPTGPARGLYERLGFEALGLRESWVWGGEELVIRTEQAGDHSAIRALHVAAFGRAEEAALVDTLRDEPGVTSLIAARAGQILGHILFSPATIGTIPVVALAPMAVKPGYQRQGIGSLLVRRGLEAISAARACVVLGHPDFYPRFGFEKARPRGITCPWPVPDEVFMVRALAPNGLAGLQGEVAYHPAFDALS